MASPYRYLAHLGALVGSYAVLSAAEVGSGHDEGRSALAEERRSVRVFVHAALAHQKRRALKRWELRKSWAFAWRWKQTKEGMRRTPSVYRRGLRDGSPDPGDEGFGLYRAGMVSWAAFLGFLRPSELRALGRMTLLLSTEICRTGVVTNRDYRFGNLSGGGSLP